MQLSVNECIVWVGTYVYVPVHVHCAANQITHETTKTPLIAAVTLLALEAENVTPARDFSFYTVA